MNQLDTTVINLGIEAAKLVAMAVEHIIESKTLNDEQKAKALADMRTELQRDNLDVQALPVRNTSGT